MKLTYNDTKITGIKRIVFKNGRIIVVRYNQPNYDLLKPSDNTKFEVTEEENDK